MTSVATFLQTQARDGRSLLEPGERAPSIEATRFGVETALRARIAPPIERDATLQWLESLATDDGFRSMVDAPPQLGATYYAVRLFHLLEAPAHRARYGPLLIRGLETAFSDLSNRDVDQLYYLCRALQLSDTLERSSIKPQLIEFFHACRAPTGGFGNKPGEVGDIEHTYCAVGALKLLGQDARPLVDADWVRACAGPDGWIQWGPDDPKRTFGTLYWGTHLALNVNIPLEWERIRELVATSANADGGWGPQMSTLWNTYCAVSASLIADVALGVVPRSALGLE